MKKYDIPNEGHLIPRVPQRLMYIDFIKTIFDVLENDDNLHGFDIGFGANMIYPILGIQKYGWTMSGSEINDDSILWAKKNIII